MPKHKSYYWLAAFAAAILFDFLFWKKPLGISYMIWTAALLVFGYLLAWWEGKKPAFASMLVSLLALGFSFVPAWRLEPMTRFVSMALTLGGLLLLSATFTNGNWPFYRLWDYFKNLFLAFGGGVSRAIMLGSKPATPPDLPDAPLPKAKRGRHGWAVVRGLLIALPLVAVLALILSYADPIFGDWLSEAFNLKRLPEYLFRAFYIVMIGCFLVGIYLHAILPTKDQERPDPNQPWMKPFLGSTEAGIVLGAVNLLFLAFVFIQFRYFFGGAVNINETGYTYAEYARKGFGELVFVAVLSLGIYLVLNTVSKRELKSSKVIFSILSVLLMANVMVMLYSSLQRLLLYEEAYGFSQLRTYTHVFIFWLAGLIVITTLLEILRRRGHFALALLVTILGFSATLAILNVDGFVAQKNISRALAGEELDVPHLVSLKDDAIPVMMESFLDPATPSKVKDDLGYSIACYQVLADTREELSWQSFTLSQSRAQALLKENQAALSKYDVVSGGGWHYTKNGVTYYCLNRYLD